MGVGSDAVELLAQVGEVHVDDPIDPWKSGPHTRSSSSGAGVDAPGCRGEGVQQVELERGEVEGGSPGFDGPAVRVDPQAAGLKDGAPVAVAPIRRSTARMRETSSRGL